MLNRSAVDHTVYVVKMEKPVHVKSIKMFSLLKFSRMLNSLSPVDYSFSVSVLIFVFG